ncbi:Do family serine endopeptidase [Cocleimonas sp. KMM 6892]|uniref:Do family serine endopeptidase n=1 Tax=unclassified Cocleimonas TaxID=2639732 RepID=UPI002DBE9114|nr:MULTISPECIES: Do family serine endopeptidase [unclassified Cocleimonas]MEB8433906.1 Do family serine endopeptidase [Cocleimonas sp. KMM 6892]MEC4716717.1 Do family serine endopeptidase [Cocleimonas sp. KMM 6895]MEC4746128.1 Do family serine endopeptidase [Cocleimonas sp. KMM 6896]
MIKSIKKTIPLFLIGFLMFSFSVSAELPDFTKLVEEHSAAVVNISTKKTAKSAKKFPQELFGEGERNEMLDELMKRFLDKDGGGFPNDNDTSSLGSGFIVSKDGYVVTNYHVIAEADEIIVKLNDRRELSAKLVGSDKRSDVALLKIEADNLPVLETGSSEDLKVGEWVIAIGSPFGFDHSVTAGIVSAKGRSLPSENYVPFIQTDVAINPGNSGGPLFNLKGKVVGINSQIFSRTGGFMGVSFAIPVDVAKRVIEQLKENGKVSRGWLGVYIQEVTRELALSFGLSSPRGALIVEVIKDGPAMGVLKQGDIVLEFNGKKIKNASALPVIVGSTELNKDVEITVRRGGKTEVLTLQLSELPSDDLAKAPVKKEAKPKKIDNFMGMELSNLDDTAKESLDVENGVMVKRVIKDPARSAGVERGDILLMFNGENIDDLEHFHELTENIEEGKTYALLVLRSGAARFLAIKIDKK